MKITISFYCLLICTFLSTLGLGQKIDAEKASIRFTLLPAVTVPDDVSTYKSFIAPQETGNLYVALEDTMINSLKLSSFERVDEDYDLEVALILGNFELLKIEPYLKSEKTTDSGTGVESVKNSCNYAGEYVFPASLIVRSYDGSVLLDTTLFKDKKFTFDYSSGYNTVEQWQTYWKQYSQYHIAGWQKIKIEEYIKSANQILSNQFAFIPATYTHTIAILDNVRKTDYDYSSYRTAYTKIKEGFSARESENIELGKEEITEAVNIWKEELKQADPDGKRAKLDKKGTYATHLNCAIGYLWLFDFEQALAHYIEAEKFKPTFSNLDHEKLKNLIDTQQLRHGMNPGWTGKRVASPRANEPVIYAENPGIKTQMHNDKLPEIVDPFDVTKVTGKKKVVRDLLVAHTWKYEKIVQVTPYKSQRVVYLINETDGEGILSHDKIRYKFNSDGSYIYTNPLGAEKADNKWWFYDDGKQIIMNMLLIDIIEITSDDLTIKNGDSNGYHTIDYLIPDTEVN